MKKTLGIIMLAGVMTSSSWGSGYGYPPPIDLKKVPRYKSAVTFNSLDTRVSELEDTQNGLETRISELEDNSSNLKEFRSIDERIDEIEEATNKRITKLETALTRKMDQMQEQLNQQTTQLQQIMNMLAKLQDQ